MSDVVYSREAYEGAAQRLKSAPELLNAGATANRRPRPRGEGDARALAGATVVTITGSRDRAAPRLDINELAGGLLT